MFLPDFVDQKFDLGDPWELFTKHEVVVWELNLSARAASNESDCSDGVMVLEVLVGVLTDGLACRKVGLEKRIEGEVETEEARKG